MAKLTGFLKGLKAAQEALTLLDQVVDIDRLIGISNAQGPQAKVIKDILTEVLNEHPEISKLEVGGKKLPSKKSKTSKKRKQISD